jgi:hypothetical protein
MKHFTRSAAAVALALGFAFAHGDKAQAQVSASSYRPQPGGGYTISVSRHSPGYSSTTNYHYRPAPTVVMTPSPYYVVQPGPYYVVPPNPYYVVQPQPPQHVGMGMNGQTFRVSGNMQRLGGTVFRDPRTGAIMAVD